MMPEAGENADSLTTSEAIPNMDDMEKEYERIFGSVETVTEEPKKRGRKKSESASVEQAPAEAYTAEDMEPWICLPFDMVFERAEKPKLSKLERKALSDSTAKVLNKWLPHLSDWQAEFGLCICLLAIVGTRYKPKGKDEEENSNGKQDRSDPGSARNGKDYLSFSQP